MVTLGRLIILLLLALPGYAWAQTSGGSVRVSAIANKPQVFSSTGDLLSHVTYEGRLAAASTGTAPMAQSLFYQRPATFSKATVAALVRKRMRNMIPYVGQALLLKEIYDEVGLIVNPTTGEIQSVAMIPGSTCGGGANWYQENQGNQMACSCGGAVAKLQAAIRANPLYATCTFNSAACATTVGAYSSHGKTGTCPGGGTLVYYRAPNGVVHSEPDTPGVAASDDQLIDPLKALDPSLDWSRKAFAEPFHWPNGTPVIANPMPAQMAAVATQYRADTGVALASGTTDPTYADESALTTPTTTTAPSAVQGTANNTAASPASSASLEFPVFCTWASSVCTALDWLTDDVAEAPADQSLPEVEVPIVQQTFNSGLGAGSCPGAVEVNFEFNGTREIAFSYQPLCDFAVMINPLILLLGAIASAFIVAGIRMKGA